MDRTKGVNYSDIGGGRRGFQDQNAVAGIAGTRVDAAFLNGIQEEIVAVIEAAGITPSADDWQQLLKAIKNIYHNSTSSLPLAQLNGLPWLPVISMSQTTPPANPQRGDLYLVPNGAKNAWIGKSGQIAEWNGETWLFTLAADGHGIGLPDGQILQKMNDSYQPQLARAVQSGQWSYGEARGQNKIDVALSPAPLGLSSGFQLLIKINATNTGSVSLNLNNFGYKQVVDTNGESLKAGALRSGSVAFLMYDGAVFVCLSNTATPSWVMRQLDMRSPLIMKQGKVVVQPTYATVTSMRVTFDLAFPSTCTGVVLTPGGSVAPDGWVGIAIATEITRSNFKLTLDTNGTKNFTIAVPCSYVAFGN